MPIKTNLGSLVPSRERMKQVITLLSHGYSNPQVFPDGKITVYPWDNSVDEWVRTNLRGTDDASFLWRLAARVCDLNGTDINAFVVGDITTVLLMSRAIRFNNKIRLQPSCPRCQTAQEPVEIKIPDELERLGEKKTDYPGYEVHRLPESGDDVKLRPLLVHDVVALNGRSKEQIKKISKELAYTLAGIVDVGGGAPDSADELLRWYQALTPHDQAVLENLVEDTVSPHLSPNIRFKCDACKSDFMHRIEFDRDFFRGDEPSIL